jgi:hypothetical protein
LNPGRPTGIDSQSLRLSPQVVRLREKLKLLQAIGRHIELRRRVA